MCPLLRKHSPRNRRGLTLVELLIAMTITSMLSVVLGGLVMAVQTARQHTNGLEEATMQARAAIDRIRYMTGHVGVYQPDGERTVPGIAVVGHSWTLYDLPDTLVLWTGGRDGGMAARGTLRRLPRINELVIYTLDRDEQNRLVEITLPGRTGAIDFRDSDFPRTVRSLIEASDAEAVLLCDRVRLSRLQGFGNGNAAEAGNVRFTLRISPSESDLNDTEPGTEAWTRLLWAQGIVWNDRESPGGLRQATVRMEFQIVPRSPESTDPGGPSIAIPFFGSASYRYAHHES